MRFCKISPHKLTRFPQLAGPLLAALLLGPSAQGAMTVEVIPSEDAPARVGTQITFTAFVNDTDPGDYRYRFSVRGPDQSRTVLKDFGLENSFDWLPNDREGVFSIEVAVRNRSNGAEVRTTLPYELQSNAVGSNPTVVPTVHPLVWLYSAPPCEVGSQMAIYFLSADNVLTNSPPKPCTGFSSMNFYIAGLKPFTFYQVKHVTFRGASFTEGPILSFTSGLPPEDLPTHTPEAGPSGDPSRPVLLAGSILANFVATDLNGDLIWYLPQRVLFLTRPEQGGYFYSVNEDLAPYHDQAHQVIRKFDLTGTTVLETNAERINDQLRLQGKRLISAFHHEARTLSNGNILTLASVEEIRSGVQGDGPVNIVSDMILVLDPDLNVVWTWDAFDHLDVTRVATLDDKCTPAACPPVFLSSPANDWLHGNSVSEGPDGNLLFSIRSQDWVVKINYARGAGDGRVIWKLGKDGDFKIISNDPDPWFSHQHDAEVEDDGTISVLDNGNTRQAQDPNVHSRGQVYRLDEQNKTAELILNADLGYYSFALGSAQKMESGNYHFEAGYLSDGTGISVETNRAGSTVYSLKATAPQYRTFRMKTMYNP